MRKALSYSIPILLAVATTTSAQQQQQQPSVVQLPSFSFFTVSTTVSVPDSGRGFMGGVKSGQLGSVTRGTPLLSKVPWMKRLFTNRGIGRATNHSGVSVTARIIDLNEMEEDLLRGGGGSRSRDLNGLSAAKRGEALFLSNNIRKPKKQPSRIELNGSLASIRRQLKAADRARQKEGLFYFQRGRKAEREGKKAVAKIFYRMAAKRADTPVRRLAIERIAVLTAPKRAAKVVAK